MMNDHIRVTVSYWKALTACYRGSFRLKDTTPDRAANELAFEDYITHWEGR